MYSLNSVSVLQTQHHITVLLGYVWPIRGIKCDINGVILRIPGDSFQQLGQFRLVMACDKFIVNFVDWSCKYCRKGE